MTYNYLSLKDNLKVRQFSFVDRILDTSVKQDINVQIISGKMDIYSTNLKSSFLKPYSSIFLRMVLMSTCDILEV